MTSSIPAPIVLFDLDGTLIDPAGGISAGISYALAEIGAPALSESQLDSLVGPPLGQSLIEVAGLSAAEAGRVIALYRRHYLDYGIPASRLYPGIAELLKQFAVDGLRLAVATSKPEQLAKRILAAHHIADRFEVIAGSLSDQAAGPQDRGTKAAVIAHALGELDRTDEPAVMVGDRSFDVEGAVANGLACIGVSWGFARGDELSIAGAAAVVADSESLRACVRSELGAMV